MCHYIFIHISYRARQEQITTIISHIVMGHNSYGLPELWVTQVLGYTIDG